MRKILYIVFLGLMSLHIQGQSLKAFMEAGEEAMETGDYYNAMYYFDSALEFDSTRLDLRYNYGLAALHFNAYTEAEDAFQFVVDNEGDNGYPLGTYHLAHVKQQLGKYDESERYYSLYLSENGDLDERYKMRAEKELEAIEWARGQVDNPTPGYTVERINGSINTPYSEFGAVRHNDKLFYSSLRFEKEKKGNRINKIYSQILVADTMGGEGMLDENLNQYTEHVAHTAYNSEGTRIYYTLCDYLPNLEIQCDIFYRDINENGNYSEEVRLPDGINSDSTTSTQPSLGYNIVTGEEFLYFTSNREGGRGGLDIWYAEIGDGGFSAPINVSEVNTPYDEISPNFHSPSGTLYFSSSGYLGMGGFDVFSSYRSDDGFLKPENLGTPVNSSFNDIYYALNENGDKGHFSSNRTGSLYLEESYEACCYDIYNVDIEEMELDLNALTFNEETRDPLEGVTVTVTNAFTGEEIGLVYNETGNEHEFSILKGKTYLIISEREGFQTDTTSLNTREFPEETKIIKKIYLKPLRVELEVFAFNKLTNAPLSGVTVVVREKGSTDAPMIATNPSGNDFNFGITAGREYVITATKPGFSTDIVEFKALDIVDGVITKNVYLMDAGGFLNSMLPITVYFHNDIPDPRTRKLFSERSYTQTYFPYEKMEDTYKREYAATLEEAQRQQAIEGISLFFENDIRKGYNRLQEFMDALLSSLQAGDVIELTLNGSASPRAANKYNLALGQRRIWTLKNELKIYDDGVFLPYIEAGQLVVTEVSLGEEIAPPDISDSYEDERESIYSVEASKERKAQIVKVRVLNK